METQNTPHKKLYRIIPGKMIAGVCNGLAAYFDVDVTVMRVLFVIGLFLTHGGMVLAYIILMLLMPIEGEPASASAEHRWERWRAKMGHYHEPAAGTEEKYSYHYHGRRGSGVIGELAQLLFLSLAIYLLYRYVPQTDPFFDKIWAIIQQGWQWIAMHINTPIGR